MQFNNNQEFPYRLTSDLQAYNKDSVFLKWLRFVPSLEDMLLRIYGDWVP